MHVMIIPSWYPLNKHDIHGSFFREQAIALGKKHRVGLIYPYFISLNKIYNFKEVKKNKIIEKNNIEFISGIYINFLPKMKSLFLKNWVGKGIKLFEKYVEKNGLPDILHVHSMLPAGLLALEIKEKYGVPFILTEHSSKYFLKNESIDLNCMRVIKNASYLSAVSDYYANVLTDKTNGKFKWNVIPNIINGNFFKKEIGESNDKINFITISFLNKNKNTILFLKAIKIFTEKLMNKEMGEVRFIIGGDGPEINNLKQFSLENNIAEYVVFKGKLKRKEVIENIESSSALILCSEFETFSVICAEANALGKPVISTKCGGPEYILNSKNGILINKNDEKALAEAMLYYIKNKMFYNPLEIREDCKKRFGEKNVINQISEVYCNIVAQNEF